MPACWLHFSFDGVSCYPERPAAVGGDCFLNTRHQIRPRIWSHVVLFPTNPWKGNREKKKNASLTVNLLRFYLFQTRKEVTTGEGGVLPCDKSWSKYFSGSTEAGPAQPVIRRPRMRADRWNSSALPPHTHRLWKLLYHFNSVVFVYTHPQLRFF